MLGLLPAEVRSAKSNSPSIHLNPFERKEFDKDQNLSREDRLCPSLDEIHDMFITKIRI